MQNSERMLTLQVNKIEAQSNNRRIEQASVKGHIGSESSTTVASKEIFINQQKATSTNNYSHQQLTKTFSLTQESKSDDQEDQFEKRENASTPSNYLANLKDLKKKLRGKLCKSQDFSRKQRQIVQQYNQENEIKLDSKQKFSQLKQTSPKNQQANCQANIFIQTENRIDPKQEDEVDWKQYQKTKEKHKNCKAKEEEMSVELVQQEMQSNELQYQQNQETNQQQKRVHNRRYQDYLEQKEDQKTDQNQESLDKQQQEKEGDVFARLFQDAQKRQKSLSPKRFKELIDKSDLSPRSKQKIPILAINQSPFNQSSLLLLSQNLQKSEHNQPASLFTDRKSYSQKYRSLSPSQISKSAFEISERLLKDAELRKLRISKYFKLKEQEDLKEILDIRKDSPSFYRSMSKKQQQELTQKLLKDAELRISRKQEKMKEKQEKEEKEAIKLSRQKLLGKKSQKLAEIRYKQQDRDNMIEAIIQLQKKMKQKQKEKQAQVNTQNPIKRRSHSINAQKVSPNFPENNQNKSKHLETENIHKSPQNQKQSFHQLSQRNLRNNQQVNENQFIHQSLKEQMNLQLSKLKNIQQEYKKRQNSKSKLKKEEIKQMIQRLYDKPQLRIDNLEFNSTQMPQSVKQQRQIYSEQTTLSARNKSKKKDPHNENKANIKNPQQKQTINNSARCRSHKQLLLQKVQFIQNNQIQSECNSIKSNDKQISQMNAEQQNKDKLKRKLEIGSVQNNYQVSQTPKENQDTERIIQNYLNEIEQKNLKVKVKYPSNADTLFTSPKNSNRSQTLNLQKNLRKSLEIQTKSDLKQKTGMKNNGKQQKLLDFNTVTRANVKQIPFSLKQSNKT